MAARAAGRYCAGAVPSLHPARAQRAARPASGGEGEAGSGRWVPSAGLSGRRAGPGRAGQASAVPMRGTAGERSGGGCGCREGCSWRVSGAWRPQGGGRCGVVPLAAG